MTKRTIQRVLCMIFAALSMVAHGELRVMLDLEHSTCLQYEPVNLMVFFLNETHQKITLGSPAAEGVSELSFVVEQEKDSWLPKLPEAVLRPITLKPGEERSLVVELSDWYDMTREGEYRIQAVVKVGKKLYASPLSQLSVVPGIELVRETKPVAGAADLLRKYRVLYWKRGLYEFAFLRVDETPGDLNYGVFELGKIVRVGKPELNVSLNGDVEVRHQSGVDCYIRTHFKSERDGMRFVDQSYELPDGSPYPTADRRLGIRLPKGRKGQK